MRPVSPAARSPFAGTDTLLIDGNNLLHRLSGSVDPGAQRLLIATLRAALPDTLRAILMLDGHPAAGTDRRQRVTRALEIHHAGSLSADDALLNIVRDSAHNRRAGLVLVTDDRALTDKARHLGARTQRLAWLEQLLGGTGRGLGGSRGPSAGTGIGAGRRPRSAPAPAAAEPEADAEERTPWTPGRGATKKRGNPRRSPRSGER